MVGLCHKWRVEPSYYQLIWDYKPEKIKQNAGNPKEVKKPFSFPGLDMSLPIYSPYLDLPKLEKEERLFMGEKKSFIPTLGKVWWKAASTSSFHAYLYEGPQHKLIGYVRIPTYVSSFQSIEDFMEIIQFFEERSDALVIDQIDNPGGGLFHIYALLSMLTDRPLITPRQRFCINAQEVAEAVALIPILEKIKNNKKAKLLGDEFFGNPVNHQLTQHLLEHQRFIVSEWEAGRTLTRPHFALIDDHINPHPEVHYTKPVVVLINQLDFSGADFFPAILQDNQRALLLGTNTAGAGGAIKFVSFPNPFGIAGFSLTHTLAERANKQPIENLGVSPDILYEVTVEDVQNEYKGYVEAINQAVEKLLEGADGSSFIT